MDLYTKRLRDLEPLIITRNKFNSWIHQGKLDQQLFLQNIEKVSEPLLKVVIKKEDAIIQLLDQFKVKVKVNQPDIKVNDNYILERMVPSKVDGELVIDQLPDYDEAEVYSK